MNCLGCGRIVRSENDAVCSEACRENAVEVYELMIKTAPESCRKHPSGDPENFHKKIIIECESLIEKLKNAEVVNL